MKASVQELIQRHAEFEALLHLAADFRSSGSNLHGVSGTTLSFMSLAQYCEAKGFSELINH